MLTGDPNNSLTDAEVVSQVAVGVGLDDSEC